MSDATGLGGTALPLPGPGDERPDPMHERRASPRYTLLIRTAKIVGRAGEALCIVRDASAHGIRIKTFHPLPPEAEFELELANGERHTILKVWEKGDLVGFRFARPIDIERLIAAAPPHLRKREISLNCLMPALVTSGAGECDAGLHQISQHGARIECHLHLALGERVRIESEALPPIMATVRSRRAPFYVLSFDRVFAFDELARACGVVAPPALAAAHSAA